MTATDPIPEPADPDVEVLDATPSLALVAHDASTVPDLPPVPGYNEFTMLCMQAKMLAESEIAPKAFKGKPHVAFHVAMIGRDLGLSPSSAIELVDVIDDRPSLSPQLRSGQVKRMGLGSIVPAVRTPERCMVLAVGPRGLDPRCTTRLPDHAEDCRCDIMGSTEFTWEDAQIAGLVREDCHPLNHSDACKTAAKSSDWQKKKAACKQNWRTYPKRMLQWRATGFCADDYFPESSLGLYSPDEIGAMTDGEGNVIDVDSVELPEGFEGRRGGRGTSSSGPAAKVDEATGEALRARANALPSSARPQFKALLNEKEIMGFPLDLPASKVTVVSALLDGIEKRASDGEWGDWVKAEPAAVPAPAGEASNGGGAVDTAASAPDDDIAEAVLICNTCGEDVCVCDAAAEALPPIDGDAKARNAAAAAAVDAEVRIAKIADKVCSMTRDDLAALDNGDLFDLALYMGTEAAPGMTSDELVAVIMASCEPFG